MESNNERFSLEELNGRPLRLLIGGSPCTHWSIAQKNNRETKPEGLGWELFENYLIAKEKFKPDFFLYENNKSAAQPIKDQISTELGVCAMSCPGMWRRLSGKSKGSLSYTRMIMPRLCFGSC